MKTDTWISVKDAAPETHPVKGCSWEESDPLLLKVKGFKGWQTGMFMRTKYGDGWRIDWAHGDFEVTHFFQPSQPPEESQP